jgi:hypothetical protein
LSKSRSGDQTGLSNSGQNYEDPLSWLERNKESDVVDMLNYLYERNGGMSKHENGTDVLMSVYPRSTGNDGEGNGKSSKKSHPKAKLVDSSRYQRDNRAVRKSLAKPPRPRFRPAMAMPARVQEMKMKTIFGSGYSGMPLGIEPILTETKARAQGEENSAQGNNNSTLAPQNRDQLDKVASKYYISCENADSSEYYSKSLKYSGITILISEYCYYRIRMVTEVML